MKKKLIYFVIFSLLLIPLFSTNVFATTWVNGNITNCTQGCDYSCNVTASVNLTTNSVWTFDNMIVQSGVTVTIQNQTTFKISGDMNISGTISANGTDARSSSPYNGGNGGSGGGGGGMNSPYNGGNGGYNGTNGSSGSGTVGGIGSKMLPFIGTGGGGGVGNGGSGGSAGSGGAGGSGTGGWGGGGGGFYGGGGGASTGKSGGGSGYSLKIIAINLYLLSGGSITSNGGNGAGGSPYSPGGGGGGGEIVINATLLNTTSANQITAKGGAGIDSTPFGIGGNGGGGYVYLFYTTNSTTGAINVSAGSGGNGGSAGTVSWNYNANINNNFCLDATSPTYSSNSTNSTTAGTPILHSLNWADNVGLSGYIFQFCNGTWNGTSCLSNIYSFCYQEFANESTSCGGLDTGSYSENGEWNDGNWDTYQQITGHIFYVNYTKPVNALSSSLWQFKDDAETTNLSIPDDCWNYDSTKLMLEVDVEMGVYFRCFNGDWKTLKEPNGGNYVWEEAMYWNISETSGGGWVNDTWSSLSGTWSNVSKTVNSTIGANIAWCVYANDTSNNWNGTSCSNPFTYNTTSDQTSPTYSKNITNTTLAGLPCNFSLEANDNVALNPNGKYMFSTNNSGTWVNSSWTSFTSTPQNMTNVTTLNSTINTIVAWCFYFNDSAGNLNATSCIEGNQFILNTTTDATPPTWSNMASNVTNNTAVNTGTAINISAQWTDNVQLSMYVNSSKINDTGSWTNGTWQTFTTGNWSNFTVIFPSQQGSNITVKIYANDTSNNQNVTGVWFWYNVSVLSDTTPPTYSSNSTNSTLAGTPILHSLNWADNVGLSGYIFQFCNGTWNGTACVGQSSNWLSGWTYRKQHNITNSTGADVNYTVNITVINATGTDSGSIVYINKTRSDFGDVRFTNSTGGLLNYWMDNNTLYTGKNATFWVQIAGNLTSTNQTIYIYYGNSTATNVSNGNNTFLLFDDFNGGVLDPAKWTSDTRGSGTVTEPAGTNVILTVHPASSIDSAGIQSIATFTNNIDIMVRRKETNNPTSSIYYDGLTLGSGGYIGFDGGSTTYWLWTMSSSYYWSYYSPTSSLDTGIFFMPASGAAVGLNTTGFSLTYNVYQLYEARYYSTSGNLTYILDGTIKDTATNTTWLNDAKKIFIQAGSYNSGNYGSSANIDWVIVRKFISTEPAHGSWGTEETQTSGNGWQNDTWSSFSGTWSNMSKTVNSTTGATIAWCVYTNDTSNNWNATSCSNPFTYTTTGTVFISISVSTALINGIMFGTINPSTNDNPALNNTNGPGGGTAYNITIDSSTTVNVDLYNGASGDLVSGSYIIGIGNVTNQANTTSNTGNNLVAAGSIALSTAYSIIGSICQNLLANSNCWISYWLDSPTAQPPGSYTTTYKYCAVQNGTGSSQCG